MSPRLADDTCETNRTPVVRNPRITSPAGKSALENASDANELATREVAKI